MSAESSSWSLHLNLSHNALSGPLPGSWFAFVGATIDLSNNAFTGTLPKM